MSVVEKINQPLQFVDDLRKQYYKAPEHHGLCIWGLITDTRHLPPFIIKRASICQLLTDIVVKVRCLNGANPQTVTIPWQVCTIVEDGENVDYLIYDGEELPETLTCGFKYVEVDDGTNPILYSQPVEVKDFDVADTGHWQLSWSDSGNLNQVPYSLFPAFRFHVWLDEDTRIGMAEHDHQQDIEENGLGKQNKIFERLAKMPKIDVLNVPDFYNDALHTMALHDDILLRFPFEGEGECIEDLDVSTEWEPGHEEGFATVELKFKRIADVVDTNCPEALEKVPCIEGAFAEIIRTADSNEQGTIEGTTPSVGDCYLIITVTVAPPNDWDDHLNEVACWNGAGWDYAEPEIGDSLINNDFGAGTNQFMVYEGTTWFEHGEITSLVDGGGCTPVIHGWIAGDHWAQIELSTGGPFSPVSVGPKNVWTQAELIAGVNLGSKPSPSTNTFRIVPFNHNCTYLPGTTDALVCP